MQHNAVRPAEPRTKTDLVEVQPHRWALSWWARTYRRILRRWDVDKHVKAYCRPITIEGRENLAGVNGPLLVIANHTSHFDTVIVLYTLPHTIWDRTAVVAAADRMYRERIKGMLHSLRYNAFPITRGGGREALAYSQWLLRRRLVAAHLPGRQALPHGRADAVPRRPGHPRPRPARARAADLHQGRQRHPAARLTHLAAGAGTRPHRQAVQLPGGHVHLGGQQPQWKRPSGR